MRAACPSCRAVFEIDEAVSSGPGLPLCDACSRAGEAPPPPRRSRPKLPAIEFGRRRSPSDPAADGPSEVDPISLDDLDVVSAPQREPRPSTLPPPGSMRDGGFARTGRPVSVLPGDPGPTTRRGAELSLSELASDVEPVSLRDLGMVLGPAAAPPAWGGAPPGSLDQAASGLRPRATRPPPQKAPAQETPSFFRVDSTPPPPPSGPPSDEIPVTTDEPVEEPPPPSSGHANLKALLAVDDERPHRTSDDLLLALDGGLFAGVRPPAVTIEPPPPSARLAPVLPLERVPPSVKPSPPAAAPQAARPPARSVAPDPVVSERRPPRARRSGLAGALGAAAAVLALASVAAWRLGAPREEPHRIVVTAAPVPPLPPVRAEAPTPAAPTTAPEPVDVPASASPARSAEPARRPEPARVVEPVRPVAPPRVVEPARLVAPPRAPEPAPSTKAPAPAAAAGEFDCGAARSALAAASSLASGCKRPGEAGGGAHVSVTFVPSGRVTRAMVSGPPFQGTPTGSCIARAFRTITVPPFSGEPVTVSKEVSVR